MTIRLAVPLIEEDDLLVVSESLQSGQLVQSGLVAEFERRVAAQTSNAYGVAVTNCTAALEIALEALGIGPNSQVAVTTYSWISTANVIELIGARPIFVDIDPSTMNMSAERLEQVLEKTNVDIFI